jgi:mono/diheme cytochrome c family protein
MRRPRPRDLLLAAPALLALGGGAWWQWGGGPEPRLPRDHAYPEELDEIPAAWQGLQGVPAPSPELRASGKALFDKACSPCHGPEGRGDGKAASNCNPRPADFWDGDRLPKHSDPFLYYRITKGKRGTCMPAFSGSLSRPDRLSLVGYLRMLEVDARAQGD